jgi:hypothetical protein
MLSVYMDEWGRRRIDGLLEDGTRILITVAAPIIKTWIALIDTNHVFTRTVRFFKLSQTLNVTYIFIRNRLVRLTHALQATYVFSRPARVIRLPAALQLTHVYGRPFRFIKLLQQLGLVREYYVSKPGVKKTKLFLVLGGLAIQLSSD